MSGTNSVRSSRNSSSIKSGAADHVDLSARIGAVVAKGGVGAVKPVLPVYGWIGQVEKVDTQSAVSVHASLLTAGEGQGSPGIPLSGANAGNTAWATPLVQIWMSPIDPTDSNSFSPTLDPDSADTAFNPNADDHCLPGGGLTPSQLQLERYFTPLLDVSQLDDIPVTTGAATLLSKGPLIGPYTPTSTGAELSKTFLVQCTQTFMVVQVLNAAAYSSTGTIVNHPVASNESYFGQSALPYRCRLETFLYPTVMKQDGNSDKDLDDVYGALQPLAKDDTLKNGDHVVTAYASVNGTTTTAPLRVDTNGRLAVDGNNTYETNVSIGANPAGVLSCGKDTNGYARSLLVTADGRPEVLAQAYTPASGGGYQTLTLGGAGNSHLTTFDAAANTALTAIDTATAKTPGYVDGTPGNSVVDQLKELNYKFQTDGTTPVTGHVLVNGETAGNAATGTTATMVYPAVNTTVVQPGPPVVPIGTQIMPQRLSTQTDRIVLQDVNNGERQPNPLTGIERDTTGGSANCAMLVAQMPATVQYEKDAQTWGTAVASIEGNTDTQGHGGELVFGIQGDDAFDAVPCWSNSTIPTGGFGPYTDIYFDHHSRMTSVSSTDPSMDGANTQTITLKWNASFRYNAVLLKPTASGMVFTIFRSFKPDAGAMIAY